MKKTLLIAAMLMSIGFAKAQSVKDHFNVGPYEVDYLGQGDVNYRLKKSVDLYEYFGLKKDTLIIEDKADKTIRKAFETGLSYSMPAFEGDCTSFSSIGLYGLAKTRILNNLYLNYGPKVAVSFGNYNATQKDLKDVLFELGVPVSVEFTKLDYTSSSFFTGIGITPAFYSTLSAKKKIDGEEVDAEKKSGLYIAPKVEIGGFIPVNDLLLKVGLTGEYRISCTNDDDNIFKHRIGRAFIGINVGIIF